METFFLEVLGVLGGVPFRLAPLLLRAPPRVLLPSVFAVFRPAFFSSFLDVLLDSAAEEDTFFPFGGEAVLVVVERLDGAARLFPSSAFTVVVGFFSLDVP